jgi:phytol kinase
MNIYLATFLTLIAALFWLRINDYTAHRGWVESRLSRKLIHIGTGPIFVLCWLLFPESPASAWLAALIPLVITVQFFLVGTGVIKDEAAIKAMSRTGDRREILHGPLYYGLIFVLLTVLFWDRSPFGITALMILCGGDGLAEVVGRLFGKVRLPWSPQKTLAGSFGMFAGSWLASLLMIAVYHSRWDPILPLTHYLLPLTGICLGATLIESLPVKEIDNLTITLAALALGFLLF